MLFVQMAEVMQPIRRKNGDNNIRNNIYNNKYHFPNFLYSKINYLWDGEKIVVLKQQR